MIFLIVRLRIRHACLVGCRPRKLRFKTVRCRPVAILARRFKFSGRGERIRTFDTLVPNQVLYQTELHPENESYYILIFIKSKYYFEFFVNT